MNRQHNGEEPDGYLGTVQVAKAVGVSVSTIKRWVDEGVLPAHRTAGGHRKLVLADVLRLTREAGLPPADVSQLVPSRRRPADPVEYQRQLQNAVRTIDGDRIRAVLRAAHRAALPIHVIADEVIAPTMAFVGRQWEHGRIDVGGEHRVSQAVVATLYELRSRIRANASANRPVALGGAPEQDHYLLPTLLAKLTLLEAGWDAVNIGPNTPTSALVNAMDLLLPKLIWVSVSYMATETSFERDYHELYQAAQSRGIAVVLGGRALSVEQRTRLPYTTFGDSMGHLAAFACSLHPLPRRPKRGRPEKQS